MYECVCEGETDTHPDRLTQGMWGLDCPVVHEARSPGEEKE